MHRCHDGATDSCQAPLWYPSLQLAGFNWAYQLSGNFDKTLTLLKFAVVVVLRSV